MVQWGLKKNCSNFTKWDCRWKGNGQWRWYRRIRAERTKFKKKKERHYKWDETEAVKRWWETGGVIENRTCRCEENYQQLGEQGRQNQEFKEAHCEMIILTLIVLINYLPCIIHACYSCFSMFPDSPAIPSSPGSPRDWQAWWFRRVGTRPSLLSRETWGDNTQWHQRVDRITTQTRQLTSAGTWCRQIGRELVCSHGDKQCTQTRRAEENGAVTGKEQAVDQSPTCKQTSTYLQHSKQATYSLLMWRLPTRWHFGKLFSCLSGFFLLHWFDIGFRDWFNHSLLHTNATILWRRIKLKTL